MSQQPRVDDSLRTVMTRNAAKVRAAEEAESEHSTPPTSPSTSDQGSTAHVTTVTKHPTCITIASIELINQYS